MIWHCFCCGKYFSHRLKQTRRNANGRLLFLCPTCGSRRIEESNKVNNHLIF